MGEEENEKYPSWKLTLMLVLAVTAWLIKEGVSSQINRFDKVEKAIEMKVDKTEYAADRKEFRDDVAEIKRFMQNQATALIVHDPRMAPYFKRRAGE